MPFLALSGTTIPVFIEPVEADVEYFGDETAAYDGTALTRRRAQKRTWRCRTPWLDAATTTTIRAILYGTPPTAVTGDLTGAISALVKVTGERRSTFAGGERRTSFLFDLREV